MKVKVKLEVYENRKYHTFDLEDLNVTEEEWGKMSDSEKQEHINIFVFDLPEQPYWVMESFDEI